MCNWFKSIFMGKKCHCEGGCCGEKKDATDLAPKAEVKEETVTENIAPKEEIKA